jgi:hypothetical protein
MDTWRIINRSVAGDCLAGTGAYDLCAAMLGQGLDDNAAVDHEASMADAL